MNRRTFLAAAGAACVAPMAQATPDPGPVAAAVIEAARGRLASGAIGPFRRAHIRVPAGEVARFAGSTHPALDAFRPYLAALHAVVPFGEPRQVSAAGGRSVDFRGMDRLMVNALFRDGQSLLMATGPAVGEAFVSVRGDAGELVLFANRLVSVDPVTDVRRPVALGAGRAHAVQGDCGPVDRVLAMARKACAGL